MKKFSPKMFDVLLYITLGAIAALCLMPLVLVISSSITDETELLRNGYRLIPGKVSFEAYKMILNTDNSIINAYGVTIFITVVGTIFSLLMTSALAYPLSVKHVKYRNKIAFYVYFTMLFNGGLVPSYILISRYLHMRDSIWVLIIPTMISGFNMFLLRNFFASIPDSLSESAKIDGANDIYILFKIVLPLSTPALATVGLFYAMGYWNEWFMTLLYIDNDKLFTLQFLIQKIQRNIDFLNSSLGQQTGASTAKNNTILPSYGIRMATAALTIGPIIFVYPFVQKYFVKGIMIGAIKG